MEKRNDQPTDQETCEYLLQGARAFALTQKKQIRSRKHILDAADPSMESREKNQESYLATIDNYKEFFQWRVHAIKEQYRQN